MSQVRLGSVGYLNARPLVESLAGLADLRLSFDTPARIAAALARGEIDVGLLPVVEAARQHLLAIPDAGIVGRGAVRSVLCLARVPLGAVSVLALDPASRTSAALLRLLLSRRHGVRPRLVAGPAQGHPLPAGADAALVIGDRALSIDGDGLALTDLGTAWYDHARLPFVFALWAGRDETVLRRLRPHLARSRDLGLAALDAIAAREAPARGLAPAVVASYLREAISYRVDAPAREGLDRFLGELRDEGLLASDDRIALLS
jgi:predicted solute-binding protein